jgi:hypothetical protein
MRQLANDFSNRGDSLDQREASPRFRREVETRTQEHEMKHRESDIQKAFFRLINASPLRGYVWATPNGGYRNKITASNMKAEGQMAGVWDVFVAIADMYGQSGMYQTCGLFIEFKTPPGKSAEKRLTDPQREFRERLQGNYAFQIHTDAVQAFESVKEYAGYEK